LTAAHERDLGGQGLEFKELRAEGVEAIGEGDWFGFGGGGEEALAMEEKRRGLPLEEEVFEEPRSAPLFEGETLDVEGGLREAGTGRLG
jgi:hypothetical protein